MSAQPRILVCDDEPQILRALRVILRDAGFEAVPAESGEQVLVRSRQVGRRLVVRVVDRGPGIPAGERERIFEPFYRSPSSNGHGSGSGLGLAIAKGFVEANDGEIEVESLPGQGSSFVVTFAAPASDFTGHIDPPSSEAPRGMA